MSLQTWLEEFMPVDPALAAGQSDLAAAEHSLKKWCGVSLENQNRHDVIYTRNNYIEEDNGYRKRLESINCALCIRSRDKYREAGEPELSEEMLSVTLCSVEYCACCPIVKMNNRTCSEEYNDSSNDNAAAMITLLELTVDWCKKQEALTHAEN